MWQHIDVLTNAISLFDILQALCIYMQLMAFAYFLYLYIDIRLHVYRAKNQLKVRIERTQLIDEYIKKVGKLLCFYQI